MGKECNPDFIRNVYSKAACFRLASLSKAIIVMILIMCFVTSANCEDSTQTPFMNRSPTETQKFEEFSTNKLNKEIKEVFDLRELGLPPPDENFDSFRRRNLLGSTSASTSYVTGAGTVNNYALTSQTVTVVARDSSGNNRNTGGDLFYIRVDNKSTCSDGFSCSLVAGAPTTITTPIFALMTDLGNGNYTYSYSVNINGYLTVSVLLYNRGYIRAQVYGTSNLSGGVAVDTYVSNINFNWGAGTVLGSGYIDNLSVRFKALLKPSSSTTYSFTCYSDDGSSVYIGGTRYLNNFGVGCNCNDVFSVSLAGNTYYNFLLEFSELAVDARLELSWSYTGQSLTIIPSSNFYYPEQVYSTPYQITVSCPPGYSGTQPLSPTMCITVCGDGLKAGTEKCDDGNTINGDGCNSSCTSVESSWVCSGGSTTSRDTCTFCSSGLYQNSATTPTTCVPHCGDGKKAGTEKCDDANTNNGDGCNSSCTSVESSWVCSGGSTTTSDTCTFCTSGWYQNDATTPTTCVTHCGDGKKAGTEKCDDANTNNGDGCNSLCTSVESSWVCSGGSTTTSDTCTFCSSGWYQNDATTPTTCVTHCGDGKRAGTEKCDDGNIINGDGCLSDCSAVQSSWVCSGGSTTTIDTCTECTAGYYQNNALTPTSCVTICGDGFEAGTEKCDDANTNNGDGCKADCSSVETGWVCIGGSTTSRDTCSFCTAGFYQNSATNPETCVPHCADGLRVGTEKCDDNNTNNNDGCKSDCSGVESGWVCSGGSSASQDTCTFCTSGWYQNDPNIPNVCVTHCGDGLEAGTEKCDDSNTNNGDGCKSDCSSVDSGWICKGGSTTSKDVCQKCSAGYTPDSSTNPENCITVCGDGKRAGSELCDDGNTSNGDGCNSNCSTIEYDWACNGGDGNNKDVCQKCHLCYEISKDQRDCIPSDIPYRIKQFAAIYLAVLCIGFIFNLLSTKMYGCSSISTFGVFYQIQIFVLIPMIGADVSSDSIYFFEYVKDLLVSFNLLPHRSIFFGYGNVFSSLNYSQSNWYLNLIGLSSGSSLYNMSNYICICCYMLIIVILIIPGYICTKRHRPGSKWHKVFKVVFDFIMSQFIFRFILLSYLFLLIISLSEVVNFERISEGPVSYAFSCLCFCFCIGMLALSLIKLISVRKEANFEKLFYTKELFNGVKKNWFSRTYSSVWMFRRILFTIVFIVLMKYEFVYKLASSTAIQGFYLIYLCVVRPFESIKDTIGEISNEVFILFGLLSMCYFDTVSKWSTNATQAYFGMLLLSNVVYTVLAIGGFVAQVIKRRLEIRAQRARTTRVEDISRIKDITKDNILNQSSIYQHQHYDMPEEEKNQIKSHEDLNKENQKHHLDKEVMKIQTFRNKLNSSDSMVNQLTQREHAKLQESIRKIFEHQDGGR